MNIPFAKADFGDEERIAVGRVLEGNWLATGPEVEAFEKEFAEYVGIAHAITCNSGSSANLLALASLELEKGSKVITSSCGFPATLAPILHLGLEPIFVDYDIRTHNIDVEQAASRLSEAKAIIFAHTLGSPVDYRLIDEAHKKGVIVIEDCCEAVGSTVTGKSVGTFGDLGTFSFYPAHQITAEGTGGMVIMKHKTPAHKLKSLRDWGKVWDWDTKLGENKTNFQSAIDDIPYYKHYIYENLGWNFKLSETASAFGRAQLKRLAEFSACRLKNYEELYHRLEPLGLFHLVKTPPHTKPSWFGFPLTLKESGKRENLSDFLELNGIRTRPFFAGNITRHKPFRKHFKEYPVADKLMRDSLFIGIGQWIGTPELDFIEETIKRWMG